MPAYKLQGRVEWKGLHISVENRKGSWRHWFDPHANRHGKTKMLHAYGYLRRTEGEDGDHLDVYLGPDMEGAKSVYVIRQMKAPDFKVYDEDKVMLGFPNAARAKAAYLAQYDNPRFFGTMRTVATDKFVEAVKRADGGKVVVKAQPLVKAMQLLHDPDAFGPWQDAQHGLLHGERLADLLGLPAGPAQRRVDAALQIMDKAVRAHPDFAKGLDFGALDPRVERRQATALPGAEADMSRLIDPQVRSAISFSSLVKALRPPKGFTPIPNSKKGGYRMQSGTGYVYWYPDGKGTRSAAHPDDAAQHVQQQQRPAAGEGLLPTPERTAEYIRQHGAQAGEKWVADHPELDKRPHGEVRQLFQAGAKLAGAGGKNPDGTQQRTHPTETYDQYDNRGGDGNDGAGDGASTVPPDKFNAADFGKSTDDPNITADQIIDQFPPEVRTLIETTEKKLKGRPQTIETERDANGNWKPERVKIHQDIENHVLTRVAVTRATPAEGQPPTVTFLGGRGGSGKSKFAGLVYDPQRAIVLDADEIKGMLPEYQGWNAADVHEESSYLFDKLCDKARELGVNVVLDATLKSQGSALKRVHQFKGEGYQVEVHYMHMPRQDSAKNAVKRFADGNAKPDGKGRYVPVDVVLSNTTNEATFDALKPLADKWSFRDNRGFQGKLISEGP